MSKVAIAPVFTIHPDQFDAFLSRVQQQRDDCLTNEPGCLHFDVLVDPDRSNTVMLYEVYTDEAALGKHRTYPHYKSFKSDTEPMVQSLEMATFSIVESGS